MERNREESEREGERTRRARKQEADQGREERSGREGVRQRSQGKAKSRTRLVRSSESQLSKGDEKGGSTGGGGGRRRRHEAGRESHAFRIAEGRPGWGLRD